MTYSGPERRHHRVFVTRNTEYHMRDDICVRVRERRGGVWHAEHLALGQQLVGGLGPVSVTQSGRIPGKGARLLFTGDLLTSPVVDVERPPREIVANYPTLLAS